MNKANFYIEYNLSNATPQTPTLELMMANGFSDAIEEFINERFCGVAKVSKSGISKDSILCSAEYTAYFFKTLLADVYGRVFLDISILSDDKQLTILISHDEPLPLTDKEMRNIIRLARNGGMQIYPSENQIRLTFSFADAALRRIYAINPRDSRSVMLFKLGEIFHCGAICFTAKEKNDKGKSRKKLL